jgi:hypothetical protein
MKQLKQATLYVPTRWRLLSGDLGNTLRRHWPEMHLQPVHQTLGDVLANSLQHCLLHAVLFLLVELSTPHHQRARPVVLQVQTGGYFRRCLARLCMVVPQLVQSQLAVQTAGFSVLRPKRLSLLLLMRNCRTFGQRTQHHPLKLQLPRVWLAAARLEGLLPTRAGRGRGDGRVVEGGVGSC